MAPIVYAPVFTWTGFYIGLNAGGAFAKNQSTTFVNTVTGVTTSTSNGDTSGFIGGVQAGYNWQFGQIVAGVEADIDYADIGRNHRNVGVVYVDAFGNPVGVGRSNSNNVFGTVRGRIGYAVDRALIYVTGGLAYAGFGGNDFFRRNSDVKAGWTLGGGVEYAFTPNWTAKIEGLYVNIDRGNHNNTEVFNGAGDRVIVSTRKNNDAGVVRVGLNYKF
ncbi:membrane protein [Alsobacter metallidurans]|uniref:Membrane protein n=2 Tax=Alsobacter metallidurans TaxID=340221 RepID=A0A917I894_9HYPH|nr:membrane protein [Alsobacter metallidurans]